MSANICMCGAEAGYPHRPGCVRPLYNAPPGSEAERAWIAEHLGECSDCPGWAVFNADHDYLGEVQRCDTCRRYATDEGAWDAARAAGLLVDDEGYVLRDPRGTA